MFPNGFASLAGFLIIALVMIISEPIIGVISVQAENVTQEQMAALEKQQETAREKQAAVLEQQEAVRKQEEEAKRFLAVDARRAPFRESGTPFDVNAIPESTLALAERIKEATPLNLRSSLAAAVYSRKFNLRPSLLLAVISNESNFNSDSVGGDNDRGYMQIIPATERFMMRSYGEVLGLTYNPKQIFEPEYNLGLGAAYLGNLLAAYGDAHQVLTEYNRGEGRAKTVFQRNNSFSTSYSRNVLELEQQYLSLN